MKNPLFSETFFEDKHVIQGGGWFHYAWNSHVSDRDWDNTTTTNQGFRLFYTKEK